MESTSAAQRVRASWVRARDRVEELGREGIWPAAPLDRSDAPSSVAFSEDGRVAFMSCSGGMVTTYVTVDLATLQVATFALDETGFHETLAVDAHGQVAVVVSARMFPTPDGPECGAAVFDLSGGPTRPRLARIVSLRADELVRGGASIAVQPGGTLLAIAGERRGQVVIVDLTEGDEVERHQVPARHGVCFSADGRWLVCCDSDGSTVLGKDGETHRLAATEVVLSLDGQRVAFAWDRGQVLEVGRFEGWSRGGRIPRRGLEIAPPGFIESDVRRMRFSPDGRRLALYYMDSKPEWNERARMVAVLDVERRLVIARATNPVSPPVGFDTCYGLGFDTSGERLLLRTHHYRSWHRGGASPALWLYSIPRDEHLGCVGLQRVADASPGSQSVPLYDRVEVLAGGNPTSRVEVDDVLVARTTHGFFGRLDGDEPLGEQADTVFERPEQARAWLCGAPLRLSPRERLQLEDLETRYRVFAEALAGEPSSKDLALATFVDAARGFTHLLPHAIERARARSGGKAGFGSAAPQLGVVSLRKTIEELASAGPVQREAFFEAQVQACVHAAEAHEAAVARLARRKLLRRRLRIAIPIAAGLGLLAAIAIAISS